MAKANEELSSEDEVEQLSYRERLTKAAALQVTAARQIEQEDLAAASADLKEALRFLRDVDEDSPKEAQLLRADILEASKINFDRLQAAGSDVCAKVASISGAQAARALGHALSTKVSDPSGLFLNVQQSLAESEGARDFCDAGGLSHLLQLCAREGDPCSFHALEIVQVLSSMRCMVPAICFTGARGSSDDNCLWWLRPAFHKAADKRQRLRGLRIMSKISDTTGLDVAQQAAVQTALRHALLTCPESAPEAKPATQPDPVNLFRRATPTCTTTANVSAGVPVLHVASRCDGCDVDDQTVGAENMLAHLLYQLQLATDPMSDADDEVVLLLCTCIRNLARDAQLRRHLSPAVPLLVHVCFISNPTPSSFPQHPPRFAAGACGLDGDVWEWKKQEGDVWEWESSKQAALLAAIEALINCISSSAEARGAVLAASHSITCRLTTKKWGIGLKNLRPPLVLTKVEERSAAEASGLVEGDIIVGVGQLLDDGNCLAELQQALRHGGPADLHLQRFGLGVLAACLWAGLREEVRAAAAAALGCLTSTYLPAQLALVRSNAANRLLQALAHPTSPPLIAAAADALANCGLAPANHAPLIQLGAVSAALNLLGSMDGEVRCSGAKLLCLLVRADLRDPAHPATTAFFAHSGEALVRQCIARESETRQVDMGGLWLQERGGASIYLLEIQAELAD